MSGISCPNCGNQSSTVNDSRCDSDGNKRRRRECTGCGNRFTTMEVIIDTKRDKYNFEDMKIGDYFDLEWKKRDAVRSASQMHGKKTGMRFSVRRVGDGYRCFRIE